MRNDLSKFGPGDEVTWPACTNHPIDPRTPDTDYTDERREELIKRMGDPDYICEGIAEASEQELKLLSAALIVSSERRTDPAYALVGKLVEALVARYCEPGDLWTPTEQEPDEPEEDDRCCDEEGGYY